MLESEETQGGDHKGLWRVQQTYMVTPTVQPARLLAVGRCAARFQPTSLDEGILVAPNPPSLVTNYVRLSLGSNFCVESL